MLIKSAGERGIMFLGNLSAGRYCTCVWIHTISLVTRYRVCVPKEAEGGRWEGGGLLPPPSQLSAHGPALGWGPCSVLLTVLSLFLTVNGSREMLTVSVGRDETMHVMRLD